jgi:hypothetical protein
VNLPAQLTLRPGTFITVSIAQPLSSGRNQQGDPFTATLARPVVVDGIVVAERGQTIAGTVVEAVKAGRAKGTSRLAVQLTDLSVVDGQQVPIQTQLVSRTGATTEGRDAGAIAGTTATGAAIGAAADWGRGAAIGAGAGAVAGVVGVLLTRGRDTVIYPEQLLTFRIDKPVTISTERAPQTFRPVERSDYDRPEPALRTRAPRRPASPWGYPYYAPAYPYWGPSFGFYSSPFWGPSLWIGRGYHRGYRRW